MLKIILVILGVLVLVVGSYVAYVFLSYHREADDIKLPVHQNTTAKLTENKEYRIMSYNIGYGAYPADYSFFMDGGKYSRAYDQATVEKNMAGIVATTETIDPDLALYQEVDQEGDRSQHVDEVAWLQKSLKQYDSVYAQNYDSAYLFYPLTQPIGKAKSGIMSFAKSQITDSTRYSLPIDTDFNKFFDLDRAFSISHLPVAGDKELALINLHLSAFTKNREVREAQIKKLTKAMADEYAAGHYVIVGGDYNHDMIGNSPEVFGTQKEPFNWTHPFPATELPEHFRIANEGLAEAKVPSVRRNNEAYQPGKSFVTIVDGFLVSDNVEVSKVAVHSTEFAYSDHDPIVMTFKLK